MSAISIRVASACVSALFLLGTLPAQTTDEGVSTSEVSKVRIVPVVCARRQRQG